MSCFHIHNLKRHPLIAVSVMDSLSRDWKISRNEGSKPHQAAAPVTHCPPGQNSCSTSQPAISGCCHLVLLQIVHIQWSLQLLSTGSALSPLRLQHSEQAQLPPVLPEAPAQSPSLSSACWTPLQLLQILLSWSAHIKSQHRHAASLVANHQCQEEEDQHPCLPL